MITALGNTWHPEHFVCVVCKMELGNTGFFERDGRPYCDKDYHQLFSPHCAYCKGPILHVRNLYSFITVLMLISHFPIVKTPIMPLHPYAVDN